ncbi:MAG: 4Fe-4S dicluster domain-containing protein [Deltaproteobacteria bacterium]|nr:4Fe-4S dicluster domain-containing protein [Deltaproteobacteria bacterium]
MTKQKPVKPSADRVIKSGLIAKPHAPQEAPHLTGKLLFFPGWCKRCGLCTVVCPNNALTQSSDGSPLLEDPKKCKLCSLCWRTCPDFAIIKNPDAEEEEENAPE